MGQFSGRVAIVTGSTSGIGEATARALAQNGASVVVAARRVERGRDLVASLTASGCHATFIETDVRRTESVVNMVRGTVNVYGRLDYAVNNAGISGTNALTADYPLEVWNDVMSTNLTGVWLCMQQEIPELLKQRGSAIVNVASDLGHVGSDIGVAPYVASKHGVLGLTRAAALEYASYGLRVNAVCPSLTETEMLGPALAAGRENLQQFVCKSIPLRRLASPHEVAAAILWLCSSAASFVTGHALSVDGGLLAR